MKAEELRIGAIVQYKWFEKPSFRRTIIHREQVSVLAIDGENKRVLIKPKQHRKNHTWVSLATIHPIPLSEDVLLKSGAVYNDGVRDSYSIGNIELYISPTHKGIILENVNGGELDTTNFPVVEIQHLHQLMNLYYALTGKELEVIWS